MPEQGPTLEQLVAAGAYNPQLVAPLEQYVYEQKVEDWSAQVKKNTYDLDSNLALLRLYQFEPKRMKPEVLSKVIIKGLMALPAVDYSLCMFFVPERVQIREPFATIASLALLLETARFAEFWTELGRHREVADAVVGFEESIQNYVVHVLSLSYRRIPRNTLAESINVDGPSLDKYIEEHGWTESTAEHGQVVTLPTNDSNTLAMRRSAGDNSFEQVAKLFPVLV